MGWREAEERAKKAEQEVRDHSDEYHKMVRGNLGSSGGSFGEGLGGLVKGVSDSKKLPREQSERDFIIAIDTSMGDFESVGTIILHFAKSGSGSTRFRGVPRNTIFEHYVAILKQYRPEIGIPFIKELVSRSKGGV